MNRPRELRALLALARARLSSRSARVRFRESERSTVERVVDVVALAFDPPRWTVAAWIPERASLRVLDVARVQRVVVTRRRIGPAPAAFDPVHFAMRRFLDGTGPPRRVTIRLAPPWGEVAAALLPRSGVAPEADGSAVVQVRATRPDVVGALEASLSALGAIDSRSPPCPASARRRSLTRRASSASPRGSSRSPSR